MPLPNSIKRPISFRSALRRAWNRVPPLPRLALQEETGFVVTPNDPVALRAKLDFLRDHPAMVAALGTAGRRRVLERSREGEGVRKCLAAYRRGGL